MDFYRCEIVEVRNLSDADGEACSRVALQECSDCGNKICERHSETCDICNGTFCVGCLSSHQAEHSKFPDKIREQRPQRKTA